MAKNVNAPQVPASPVEAPSARILKLWKKSTGTKKHGDLEPRVYAYFDCAFWVASRLHDIKSLSDPHPILKMVRAELGQLSARAAREYGDGALQVVHIAVQVNDPARPLRAALSLERGSWRYRETATERPGFRPAETPDATDTADELRRQWDFFLVGMTSADTYALVIDARARRSTLDEMERLARGPSAGTKTGAPPTDAAVFAEWLLRTVSALGMSEPSGREVELLGDDAGVEGLRATSRPMSSRQRKQMLATMIRRAKERIGATSG